jgi:hypothetical protein
VIVVLVSKKLKVWVVVGIGSVLIAFLDILCDDEGRRDLSWGREELIYPFP